MIVERKKFARGAVFVIAAAGLLMAGLLASGWPPHGHVIAADLVPNHPGAFDFTRPPCRPATRPPARPGDVTVRYLGAGGIYVEWRQVALLTAPFFSNPGALRAALGTVRWNREAIARGLSGLPLERVRAVLVGHSHYDHLGDLPPILLEDLPGVPVYVNRSGSRMLAAFDELGRRTVDVEDLVGSWIEPAGADGRKLPFRFMPLASGHAPHLSWFHYAAGEVTRPWSSWRGKPLRAMKEGRTFAFLIDLLDEDGRVAFRIHYQDAAATAPAGFPPAELIRDRPVDLAVLCMPSYWLLEGYPERLLRHSRARHAMIIHYEDFFRPTESPLRFVALLSDRRAHTFVERVADAIARDGGTAGGPQPCGCGPCGDAWSMPLPGEWLAWTARNASADVAVGDVGDER